MIIEPNWTVSDQGPWQLIYNDQQIISLLEVRGSTSTQGKLFVGTLEDCEAEIERLALPFPQIIVDEEVVGNQEEHDVESPELDNN